MSRSASWADTALARTLGLELPIIQAPMAGSATPELAAAVAGAGGLGSLGLGMVPPDEIEAQVTAFRRLSNRPLNLNFFTHPEPADIETGSAAMREAIAPLYAARGLGEVPAAAVPYPSFGEAQTQAIERLRPQVVSFHFGLPETALLDRVRAAGAVILSSATTVAEAVWLAERGVDAVIAQGLEAGGHRGAFLPKAMEHQSGLFSLLPQVVDAVDVPVIAAGGIADGRGIAAAMMLGAEAAQIGTAFLGCPEANVHPAHRTALAAARERSTRVTSLFTGRPARSLVNRYLEEMADCEDRAAPYPAQISVYRPLAAAAPPEEAGDWLPLWSGQSAALARALPAAELVAALAEEAARLLGRLTR